MNRPPIGSTRTIMCGRTCSHVHSHSRRPRRGGVERPFLQGPVEAFPHQPFCTPSHPTADMLKPEKKDTMIHKRLYDLSMLSMRVGRSYGRTQDITQLACEPARRQAEQCRTTTNESRHIALSLQKDDSNSDRLPWSSSRRLTPLHTRTLSLAHTLRRPITQPPRSPTTACSHACRLVVGVRLRGARAGAPTT